MSRHAIAELLDSRKLFDVTLTDLIGPQTVNSKYNYDNYDGATLQSTEVQQILGPATFDGHAATRVKSIDTGVGGSPNSTLDRYITVNSTQGLIFFGSIETTTDGSTPETIRTNYEPYKIQAPPSLSVGKVFKYTFDQNIQTVTPDTTTTTSESMTVHLTLESDTKVSVNVPAGTFSAYLVQEKLTTGASSDLVDDWFAPGIGLIKSVASDGGSMVLTAYKL